MSSSEACEASDRIESGWDAIRDLPPSAKLVAKTLEYNDRLTQSQLAEETLLPQRTVRSTLSRLEDANVISSEICFVDARKQVYELDIKSGRAGQSE